VSCSITNYGRVLVELEKAIHLPALQPRYPDITVGPVHLTKKPTEISVCFPSSSPAIALSTHWISSSN
jgi:hypothetical protein